MTFNEKNINRDTAGRFDEKPQSAAEARLPVCKPDIPQDFLAVWDGGPSVAPDAYARMSLSIIAEPNDPGLAVAIRDHGAEDVLAALHAGEGARVGVGHLQARMQDAEWRMKDALRLAAEQGMTAHTAAEGGIPACFDDLGLEAPLALWVKGDAAILHEMSENGVSVVGARAATSYGDHVATEFAAGIAEHGGIVVSGGAYGIDASAHRGAIAAGGRTVAFMAGGLDRPYPAGNAELIRRCADSGGAVVSEVAPGSAPTKWRFFARQRLLAAAAPATVVVEAGHRSGSLSAAFKAAEMGRVVAAVPGPITSAASMGANQLIANGTARLVTCAADVQRHIEEARA